MLRQDANIYTATFSPDDHTILTASADRSAVLWNAASGKPTGIAFQHGYWIFSAAFDTSGARLVTASWDHTARVWDAVSGKPLTLPLQHADAVLTAGFSPASGDRVLTVSRDGTARVWDASTGAPLTLPLAAENRATSARFTPDGASVLVTAGDGTAEVLDLAPQAPAPAWLADLADFASTQVRYSQAFAPDMPRIRHLRETLLGTSPHPGDAASWELFGKWYFLESDVRPVSQWSRLSLQQYVDELTSRDDAPSLAYAEALAQDHPLWMARLSAKHRPANPAPKSP